MLFLLYYTPCIFRVAPTGSIELHIQDEYKISDTKRDVSIAWQVSTTYLCFLPGFVLHVLPNATTINLLR